MSDHTPSRAEGDRDDDARETADHPAPGRPTPSRAEGERYDADDADDRPARTGPHDGRSGGGA
ncbi:hypothetical protein [Streptomyces asoensis]|uniref:Uncharacterized protein n=1 Tax=Streptomyces asoensis TaxID=249586 RepID=A0ABQ3S713_9ACTN|nr:hypothetical protein [Streptomyces asoensis]GGQ77295.1 hypothetical protein GCM10010496_46090 [Streptomyces asoensis]GHI63905.1 hypothetical protein Saso_55550 [Streptomyces asoensis]